MTESERTSQPDAQQPSAIAGVSAVRRGARLARALAVVLVVFVAVFAVWMWYETNVRLAGAQEATARTLRALEGETREARMAAREAQEAVRDLQAKIAQLDSRMTKAQIEQIAHDALVQEIARTRDELQVAELEQLLAIAAQHLQLSGNVRGAVLALRLAESRLARSERPHVLAVRRAIGKDIERLRALPVLDIAGLGLRLDRLMTSTDRLPLANDLRVVRSREPKAAAASVDEGFWQRLGSEVWAELKTLVVVRRTDDTEPPLLAPSQAYFLRENLKLRLLNARLSLYARDEVGYREQLRVAQIWVARYFDSQSKQTAEALGQLKELASVPAGWDVPGMAESLEAVHSLKLRRGGS